MSPERRLVTQLNQEKEMHALRAERWFGSEGVSRCKQQEVQTQAARCLLLLLNISFS